MEAASESRNVSIKVLRPKTKALISELLNPQMFIPTSKCILRDWQGLAGLCKIGSNYEASLVQDADPTSKVLKLWYEKDPEHSTIEQFLTFLEEMDRFDVVEDISELIDEDIRIHAVSPQQHEFAPISLEMDKYIITNDDVKCIRDGLALEHYDAFLLYDQDDINFAIEVLETMEKDYNMKFCCKNRDLVGGGLEMDKIITLITERCNRVIVILSDSLFKSSMNDYFVKFAEAYGIEKQRKIIPIIYKELATQPAHIKFLFALDYRQTRFFNFWEKLKNSIIVGDPEKMKVNRSRSDNGQTLRSALHENNNSCRLRPLQHAVKFSSSVGDLKNLESVNTPPLNPSTSADNLPYVDNKKKKKHWFERIKGPWKKEKTTDCMRQEREKNKGFRKHWKRAAAVAN